MAGLLSSTAVSVRINEAHSRIKITLQFISKKKSYFTIFIVSVALRLIWTNMFLTDVLTQLSIMLINECYCFISGIEVFLL